MTARRARLAALAAVLCLAAPAGAGVVLFDAAALRDHTLPPLIPMPDGMPVAANDIARQALALEHRPGDVLIYDAAQHLLRRYGDTTTLSLPAFGAAFGAALLVADPATLLLTPFAAQDEPLDAVLARPGAVVVAEVGPALLPPSALAIDADDVHTATPAPSGTPPPAPSGTPTPPPSVTPSRAPAACRGDCDADDAVTVAELVRAVTIALGQQPPAACPGLDANASGTVSIDELIVAIGNALIGC